MGTDDTDLARKAYAAFNRGDVETALQHLDPQIEWNMHEEFARAPRTFRGHEGVREVWAIFREAIDDLVAEPARVHDAVGAIVAEVRMCGRARGTQERVLFELVHVWTIRDRRATRLDVYTTPDEAWAALGTTPPDRSSASISPASTGRENR